MAEGPQRFNSKRDKDTEAETGMESSMKVFLRVAEGDVMLPLWMISTRGKVQG